MSDSAIIYTDGSCLGNKGNDPGGWAFIYLDGKKEWHMSGGEEYSTNNKMELTAAIEALEFCAKKNITIYSDSQYVIKGITQWIGGWKKKGWAKVKNREYWEKLDKLRQGKRISWNWVKAHDGNTYNEMVDKLARAEAKKY